MRLLITGGAGFIGSNLARYASESGDEVVVIDNLSTGLRTNLDGLDLVFHEASILDVDSLDRAVKDVDSIVHLGALGSVPRSVSDPVASHHANATGTLNVLEAARRADVRHLICASSSSVYGMNPALPKSERAWVRPVSPYAVSKLATEQYTLAYQQSFGLETLAFRFFNVYGPYQRAGHPYAAVIPVFIDAILNGRPVPVNGDGTQSRDFTFVGTVCRVLLEAAHRRTSHPEPVNLAFGTNTTLIALLDQLRTVTGAQFAVEHHAPRPGDVPHSQADNHSLRSLFEGIEPVSLRDGLKETVSWFRNLS